MKKSYTRATAFTTMACPTFAVVYPFHPEMECRPFQTPVIEMWEIDGAVALALETRGLAKAPYEFTVRTFDATVFDWDEINMYLEHKYAYQTHHGDRKITIKDRALYEDLV
jgi:hypothetical protein